MLLRGTCDASSKSLACLCADVLDLICGHLDAHQRLLLLLTGSKCLQCKLLEITRELRFEVVPFQKPPLLAFTLPKLTSLSLQMTEGYASYPLTMPEYGLAMIERMEMLVKLELSCAQSFSFLLPSPAFPPLSLRAPCLESLSLTRSTQLLTLDHLQNLPSSIKKLVLLREPLPRLCHRLSIPHDLLTMLLPVSLESLEVNYVSIDPDEQSGLYEGLQWPKNLRKLRISLIPSNGRNHSH